MTVSALRLCLVPVSDPIELKSQMVDCKATMWVLGIELGSSGKATSFFFFSTEASLQPLE